MTSQLDIFAPLRYHPPGGLAPGKRLFGLALYVAVALLVGLIGGVSHAEPMIFGLITGVLLLLPLIWQRPVLSLYILIGGAAVFETFPLGFPDSLTDKVPFFQSASSVGGPGWIIISGAELLIILGLGAVAMQRVSLGKTPLKTGPLFLPLAFYMAMVGYGLVQGRAMGGDTLTSFWEARSQIYLILAYMLVVNTIQEKSQLTRLVWILLLGIGLKGVLGTWRYLVTLGGDTSTVTVIAKNNSILAHEESYFFALFFILALILFLFRSNRAQLWFTIVAATPVLLAFLANERRASHLILMIGIVMVLPWVYRLLESRRKVILRVAILIMLLGPLYIAATWNTTAKGGEPARAIKSLIAPNERDASSNDYREKEALNLKYNIALDPIRGLGYGRPIDFVVPVPYTGDIFIFWNIIPHNSILWVWMRLGFVGFVAFWFLIGRALVSAMVVAKQLSDPYLQSMGVFTVVALFTWVVLGALDMGLADFRVSVLIGGIMGLVGLLPQLESKEARDRPPDTEMERHEYST